MSAVICTPFDGAIAANLEAYMAFLQGKGGQGGKRAHLWEIKGALQCVYREAPVIFDVGANLGHWSQTLISHAPGVQVFQIEPQKGCQDIIRALDLPNSTLLPVALGAEEAELTLLSPTKSSGIASFHKRADSRWKDLDYTETTVPVAVLPKLLESHDIAFLDFMKMDIEGHEFAALKGAEPVLAEGRLGGLSFEFGPGNVNSRTMFIDFFELLSDHGFEILRIRPGGALKALPVYDEDCEFYRGSCNYVARLKDHPHR
ncbi:MAG: FkbM family methyltransferase [Pseudomonadota bacterium]